MLQLLSCSNSKIYFRTRSNYIAPEEDRRPSERVTSSCIVGWRPIGTASDSESEDDDTDDGAEVFSQDSAPAMMSSQLSSSSASANSATAPSAASRRPEVVEETSADVLSTPSGRKPAAGKWRRKGPGKEATMGGGQIRVYPCPLYGVCIAKIVVSTNVLSLSAREIFHGRG